MTAHREFLAVFDQALRGGALPPGLTARDPQEIGRRFDVYRNNVASGLSQALATRFPVVRRLVGDEFFTALARLYAETDRPRSPVLAEWGAGFAGFLDRFPPLSGFPYMGDVARIEHARGRSFHAADAAPIDPSDLADADPAVLRLRLHPSVFLLKLAHPAVSIWHRNQSGGEGLPLAEGPETALILRDRAFMVPVAAVSSGDAALVTSLASSATLADAAIAAQMAEPGHDPQSLLVSLMRAGAIVRTPE